MPASESSELRALAQVVRQLRQQADLSQEKFAERAGIHRNHVGQIERGELNPSLSVLFKLASAGGVSFTDLAVLIEREMVEAHPAPSAVAAPDGIERV